MANNETSKVKFLEVKQIAGGLKFAFGNGASRSIILADFNEAIQAQAMEHGFNQKLRDTTAGFSKDSDYEGALEKFDATLQALYDGDWNRSGGGVAGQQMKDLATAIAEIRDVEFDVAFAAVQKMDADKRKAIMKNAKVAQVITRLVADRAQAAADSATDDLDIEL